MAIVRAETQVYQFLLSLPLVISFVGTHVYTNTAPSNIRSTTTQYILIHRISETNMAMTFSKDCDTLRKVRIQIDIASNKSFSTLTNFAESLREAIFNNKNLLSYCDGTETTESPSVGTTWGVISQDYIITETSK